MISSQANQKVKQVIQWRDKPRERKKDRVYLVEGFKLFEYAPEQEIKEVYISEEVIKI